jgi:hypothetical protein
MATDAPAAHAALRPLPPLGSFLSRVFDLGKQSIPPALPALVFLWFYNFGTELYLELAGGGTSPLGYPDTEAKLFQTMLKISAYLPLLVLVYTPFLPLQDSLLRGERPSFLAGIRHVLERLVSFVVSAVLQFLIVLAPVLLVIGVVALAIAPLPTLPPEAAALVAVAVAVPCVIWLFLAGMFLLFAIPAVVLDGHGPLRSIGVSARMVAGHFWGLLGRFLVFFLVLFVMAVIASIPAAILSAGASLIVQAGQALRIASILWTSLITALTFPFWVAALMVLYRSLAPAGGEVTAADAATTGPLAPDAPRPGHGEQPTPYIFE